MQKMIIDGYNVIHADHDLKRAMRKAPLDARRALIERLARYLEDKRLQLTVVFDGHGGIADVDVEIPGKLQVLFSPAGQTADDLILDVLEESANPRRFIVVTSDVVDIGRSAGAMGAEVISSRAFLSRIRPVERQKDSPPEEEAVDDIDYWLEQFGKGGEADDG